jgi:hypothetical protein
LKPDIRYVGFTYPRKRLDQAGICGNIHLRQHYIYITDKHKAALLAMLAELGNIARIALA